MICEETKITATQKKSVSCSTTSTGAWGLLKEHYSDLSLRELASLPLSAHASRLETGELMLYCCTKPDVSFSKQLWHLRVHTQLSMESKFYQNAHITYTSVKQSHHPWPPAICQAAYTQVKGEHAVVTCCQYSSRDGNAEKYPVSCTIWSSWKILHMGMTSISLLRCSHTEKRFQACGENEAFCDQREKLDSWLYWHV